MNNIFLCLKKGSKNIAKYVIFSVFFVFAFLFSVNGEVDAAISSEMSNSIFTNGSQKGTVGDFEVNDTLVGSGTDDLTISPKSAMTRAQMAKIMVCYHNNLAS